VSPTPSQPKICQECFQPFEPGYTRYTLKVRNTKIFCAAVCAVAWYYGELVHA
jgi:hypothetical protein